MDRIVETTESTTAPKIAASGPEIVSPGTTAATNHKIMALTTNVNKPKVKTLRGKVKNTKTGFINVLISPKIIAASTATPKFSTPIPGTI